jgi:hypothetical protein
MVPAPTTVEFLQFVVRAGSKEGARPLFEGFMAQLVRTQYPSVKQVRVRPGDKGIDAFVGELDDAIAVWQAKFFIDGVGVPQYAQIRDSLEAVVAYATERRFKLTQWTLCIPTSFDIKGHEWWAKFKRDFEMKLGLKIELWDATELMRIVLLPDARALREYYFGQVDTERPLEDLPDPSLFEDSLFVLQLREAGHVSVDAAKREFYNAEILSKEIADKGIEDEVQALSSLRSTVHSMWEYRFNAACLSGAGDRLPDLHANVMGAIESDHRTGKRWGLPAGVVHKFGLVHQLVDFGRAGWVRRWKEIALAQGR